MDSCKFTPFGLCVKTELLKRGKTQRWLEDQIESIGMYMDSGYMYKITKLKEVCDCWIKKEPYNCGQEKCPGYRLFAVEKSKT